MNQSLEVILEENQLERHFNIGLTEPKLIDIVAGLIRKEFRTHVRLQQPMTFGDFWQIAGSFHPATSTLTEQLK